MAGIAYYILSQQLIALHGKDSTLAKAVGKDQKGKLSVIIYFIAIPIAFINPTISLIMYASVTAIWWIPDRRIEKKIVNHEVKG